MRYVVLSVARVAQRQSHRLRTVHVPPFASALFATARTFRQSSSEPSVSADCTMTLQSPDPGSLIEPLGTYCIALLCSYHAPCADGSRPRSLRQHQRRSPQGGVALDAVLTAVLAGHNGRGQQLRWLCRPSGCHWGDVHQCSRWARGQRKRCRGGRRGISPGTLGIRRRKQRFAARPPLRRAGRASQAVRR
jgi:hypothetical protein